jgi:preprotein translocase subunit SecF
MEEEKENIENNENTTPHSEELKDESPKESSKQETPNEQLKKPLEPPKEPPKPEKPKPEKPEPQKEPPKPKKSLTELYNQHYKILLLIPIIIFVLALVYMFNFYTQNGDIIRKDVTLTGGTTITVFDQNIKIENLKSSLESEFPDIHIRAISNFQSGTQAGLIIQTKAPINEIRSALEEILGYELAQENSSIEFSGEALSQGFYKQLRFSIILAFIFMAIVVFIIFRTLVPSAAVIAAALSDIVMTLAVVNLSGMVLSTAGIIAFLMIIGYSVDTDILLTTRVIKRKEGEINERLSGALKTGLTMTLTSIAAISVALLIIYNISDVLRQIFTILLIGLGFDILNTWLFNASIIKWYAEKNEAIN